jgi:hypothetical protein
MRYLLIILGLLGVLLGVWGGGYGNPNARPSGEFFTALVTAGAQTITATDTSDNTITGSTAVAVNSPAPAPGGLPHGQSWPASQAAAFADQVFVVWFRARSRHQPWGVDWLDGADPVLV